MSWNLEGLHIEGHYMGEFPCSGKVEYSRVKYGGEVTHCVILDTPIVVYGAVRERITIENKFIERVSSSKIVA